MLKKIKMEFTLPEGKTIEDLEMYQPVFADDNCDDEKMPEEEECEYIVSADENLGDKLSSLIEKINLESQEISLKKELENKYVRSSEFIEEEHGQLVSIVENLENEDEFINFLNCQDYKFPFVVLDHMLHYDLNSKYHHYYDFPKEILDSISKQVSIMIRVCGLSQIEIEKLVLEHRYVVIHCILNSLFHDNQFNSEMIVMQFIISILDNEESDDDDFTDHLMVKILYDNVNFLKESYFRVLIDHDGWVFLKDQIIEMIEENSNLRSVVRQSKNDYLKMNF